MHKKYKNLPEDILENRQSHDEPERFGFLKSSLHRCHFTNNRRKNRLMYTGISSNRMGDPKQNHAKGKCLYVSNRKNKESIHRSKK